MCVTLGLDVYFAVSLEAVFIVAQVYMGTRIWPNRWGIVACESGWMLAFLLHWCCQQWFWH